MKPKPKPDRSNHTPVMNFRVRRDLHDAARQIAAQRGETLTAILTAALESYVKKHGQR